MATFGGLKAAIADVSAKAAERLRSQKQRH